MFKIKKASKKELKIFYKTAWIEDNIVHYGHPVKWEKRSFRYKVEDNGKIIGSIYGDLEAGVLKIGTIIVDRSFRGKGIGKSLLEKAEEFGKKYGAHKIWLKTGKDWEANKFYKKLGYKLTAELPKHHFKTDYVIYSKFL